MLKLGILDFDTAHLVEFTKRLNHKQIAEDQWNRLIKLAEKDTSKQLPDKNAQQEAQKLADAVAASCAIPGFYRPVEIGGRRYVDGGLYSASNLDLLRDLVRR